MSCYSNIIYLYREIESQGNKEDEYTVRIYAVSNIYVVHICILYAFTFCIFVPSFMKFSVNWYVHKWLITCQC